MTQLYEPLLGGILIGLSALAMLGVLGRITGISGILAGAIGGEANSVWRWAFLVGLVLGQPLALWASGDSAPAASAAGWPVIIIAGFLVGFGTRCGGGCTSGHGVCGIGRLAPRSIAATATFISAGMATVYVGRHLFS